MARIGVNILKRCTFRGVSQEFGNTYYFEGPDPVPNNTDAGLLIDQLTADEKVLHSQNVTFLMGRLWKADGTPAENVMIRESPLSGQGAQTVIGGMDRERAVLIRWPAGIDIRGRPVFLRKWYHSCGGCAGVLFGQLILENVDQISAANRTTIENAAAAVAVQGATSQWTLCGPTGRNLSANQPTCHPYLEHRQLGDAWRG